nr:WS/DGAT domain-containing protein [Amycolatopsis panacis]
MLHETSGSGDDHAASHPSLTLGVVRGASEPNVSHHIPSPPPGALRDASEPGDDHPAAQQRPPLNALRTAPEPSGNPPVPHPNRPLDTAEPDTDHPAPGTPLDIPEPRKNHLPTPHPPHGALSSTPEPDTGRSTPRPRPPLDAHHGTPEPTESAAAHPHPPHDARHDIPEPTASPATPRPRPPHDAHHTTPEPTSNHLTPHPPHDAGHATSEPATSHRPTPRSHPSQDTHHHTREPVSNHPTPHPPHATNHPAPHQSPSHDHRRDTPKPTQPIPRPPRPRSPLDTLRQTLETATIASSVVRAARPPQSPVIAPATAGRRLGFAQLPLTDLRRIRRAHGGTTHDVVLAILSGALRTWLLNRGVRADDRTLRALVPVSVRGRAAEQTGGNKLSGYLCELPVGLDDPVRRLHRIRTAMARNKAAGPHRGAGAFPLLAERVPTLLHRLGTRTAGMAAPLLFDLVITSVPVPAPRLTLDGAPLVHVHPFVPLAPRQAVGIAVAPYRDTVHIGLQANADAVPDLGALRDAVAKSAAELVHTG